MTEAVTHTSGSQGRGGNRGGPRRGGRGRGSQGRTSQTRERPTHFISVPLDHLREFTSQVSNFIDSMLAVSPPIAGLDSSIVVSPSRLHLTLGVMNLASEEHQSIQPEANPSQEMKAPRKTVADALAVLRSLKPDIESALKGQPLQLCLNEFEVMHRSPGGEADVMYIGPTAAGAQTEEHMQSVGILETVNRRFIEEGFITETRPLKLHCTILNTRYRKPANKHGGQRLPFSMVQIEDSIARNPYTTGTLLSSAGLLEIRELNLCRMGSYDKFGRYVRVGGIEW